MLLKLFTAAAGLLAIPATQAFLVSPEISDADIQVANTIESLGDLGAETQVVDVECPGCPILVRGRRGKSFQRKIDRPSHLELTFSVDHQPDHDRLLVNGFELYPTSRPSFEPLLAPQIVEGRRRHRGHDRHDRDHNDRKHRVRPSRHTPQPQRLGFTARVSAPKKDANRQFELVEVELQIIEVGIAFIDGIPNVKVTLIKDAEGRLLMSQIEKSEPKQVLEHPNGGAEQCETMMCEWVATVREKLKGLKGFGHCHGGHTKGGTASPALGEAPHGHPHHHHLPGDKPRPTPFREHRWGKLFKHIGSHILLPVLIGIVAGVSVSLIGMAVGTVIVSLWRVVFRRRNGHRRHHSHHNAAHKEAALDEEKSGLMEHEDLPPSYDEETTKTSQA
ncbi:hypothetical protein N657DRAFT_632876 [Parathielavia appendiculata]|uniref:DUF7728 domain-containing protein n=1 Tax=Parathielavia appendiculata TaxID=2587402 RepID=A0AAN6Z541_9PEZI|nr:hypothetical protein N657DRAFT_632876 [Parathielavia appendiculata]